MEFTATQIAEYLHGTVEGDATVKVHDFAKIEEGEAGKLSFLSNPKYEQYLYTSKASIVLVNNDFTPQQPLNTTIIRVENAYESLAALLTLVQKYAVRKTGISTNAHISTSATIGENAYIAPFVYIGENTVIGKNAQIHAHCTIEDNVKIGDNFTSYANVTINDDIQIGNNCILHAGVVIGGDGFGFAPSEDGSYNKIPQTGNVIIEDNVEVGSNSTIDRATLGSTIIRSGVKIDNLVQIAHNVEIGENTVMAAQTGIAGSTKIGKHCVFAGQVGVAGHINIADGTIFGAQSGVPNSVKLPNQILMGYPAIAVGNFRRSTVVYKNLPELQRTVYELEKKIETEKK
ncbi:MAG: UDP-3-O-(3-hydroxymyristoyl)glucosamine N-acyltransferase [Paludibacter sp.]|jgi:UDP-3-O-[3-hydroxymyristoyl] glucosamine N-acyltransferase|nr:UDP-3-O-(3-hydroxymyristoyl)glucosamine N-acyltransferase [Paludibacter sp.]